MSFEILLNFYRNTLPLYPNQPESALDQANQLNQQAFRYTFSVNSMIKISRIIEQTSFANPSCDLHVSFQYLSRIRHQQKWYEELAYRVNRMWLYYAADESPQESAVAPLLSHSRVQSIDTTNSPLEEYWFVVAYGAGVSQMLLAHEIPGEGQRQYQGFFTFDGQTTYQILSILNQIYPTQLPVPKLPSEF
jgi:hypothetical protein